MNRIHGGHSSEKIIQALQLTHVGTALLLGIALGRGFACQVFGPRKEEDARALDDRDVEGVLHNPIEVIETKFDRQAGLGRTSTGGKFVVVVHEVSGEGFIVVTAIKVDGVRARRYGFTRV